MKNSKTTGRRIQRHRRDMGMSPERFGEKLGVSGMTIRRIEQGQGLQDRTAFLIAGDLGVTVSELWPAQTAAGPRRTMVAA